MTFRTSFPLAPRSFLSLVCFFLSDFIHVGRRQQRPWYPAEPGQGDVRILHDSKGDPLANDKAPWERAELNLPIRQHDVIATDDGRAEVEFENGAMALVNENTVLEFFDLSLEDGALTTRLILRQGTAGLLCEPCAQ